MARFYRYETVNIPLQLTPSNILENYKHIVVTITQDGMTPINKTEDELLVNTQEGKIVLSLTQEETGKFVGGNDNSPISAKIQVNIYNENAERDVSTMGYVDVYDNLYKKVITDE